jgi:hypothetical protein
MSSTNVHRIDEPSCFRSGANPSGTADIAAKRLLKESTTAGEVAIASATTDAPAGVSTETIYGGSTASYQFSGRAVVTSGGVITAGDQITTDSAGKAVVASQSPGATQRVWGVAKTAASGTGEDIVIELGQVGLVYNSLIAVATRAELKAIAATNRFDGMVVLVKTDESNWVFESAHAGTADTAEELLIAPSAGTGRWVRADKAFVMKIPISYANTDGEVIELIPEGFVLRMTAHPWWEITASFTGGSSSAIGVSTNISGYTTAGDIIGGATGDLAATLDAGLNGGTIGGELDDQAGFHALLFVEGSEFQFDAITSAFTAGTGYVCVPVALAKAPATP